MKCRMRVGAPSRLFGLVSVKHHAAVAEHIPSSGRSVGHWRKPGHDKNIHAVLLDHLPNCAKVPSLSNLWDLRPRRVIVHFNLESRFQEEGVGPRNFFKEDSLERL